MKLFIFNNPHMTSIAQNWDGQFLALSLQDVPMENNVHVLYLPTSLESGPLKLLINSNIPWIPTINTVTYVWEEADTDLLTSTIVSRSETQAEYSIVASDQPTADVYVNLTVTKGNLTASLSLLLKPATVASANPATSWLVKITSWAPTKSAIKTNVLELLDADILGQWFTVRWLKYQFYDSAFQDAPTSPAIWVDLTWLDTKASGVFARTAWSDPELGDWDQIVIGGKIYTLQATLTDVDWNVQLEAADADTITNLYNAINLSGTPGTDYATSMTAHPSVAATAKDATSLTVTANQSWGENGNTIATTATIASTNFAWGAATLASWAYPTLTNIAAELDALDIVADGKFYSTSASGAEVTFTPIRWGAFGVVEVSDDSYLDRTTATAQQVTGTLWQFWEFRIWAVNDWVWDIEWLFMCVGNGERVLIGDVTTTRTVLAEGTQ